MQKNKYGGFFYNLIVYTFIMIIASFFPFLVRMIASIFIESPSVIQTSLDAACLFDSVYPVLFVLTTAAFLIGGYVACYFTGYRIGHKSGTELPKRRVKTQMILCGVLVYLWNMFFGISEEYCGFFGFQFWYPAAVTGKRLGLFDISSIPINLEQADIVRNNFIIVELNDTIGFIIFCYSLIFSILFTWASYKGRIAGEKDGIKTKNRFAGEAKKD